MGIQTSLRVEFVCAVERQGRRQQEDEGGGKREFPNAEADGKSHADGTERVGVQADGEKDKNRPGLPVAMTLTAPWMTGYRNPSFTDTPMRKTFL